MLESIEIKNKYALFSTLRDDVIFQRDIIDNFIFCGGQIKSIDQDVYNFKLNEYVGYILCSQDLITTLTTNQIVKIPNKDDLKTFAILPYASYGMKILRMLNLDFSKKILIIGKNIFTILLKNLIKLSGASAYLFSSEALPNEIKDITFDNIIYDTLTPQINSLIANIKYQNKMELNKINLFDKGLDDRNYLMGIKYPYAYVRWDFKRNLEYFINLVETKKVNLDFFNITAIQVNNLAELRLNMNDVEKDSLILYKIITR
ncbi:MAG: hypothetical protein ACFFA8_00395 [Promethearchaeota archaeon]